MPKNIVLKEDLRVFQKPYGPKTLLLGRTGYFMSAGSTLTVSDAEKCSYDHGDVLAVSFIGIDDKTYYLLKEEIDRTATDLDDLAKKPKEAIN